MHPHDREFDARDSEPHQSSVGPGWLLLLPVLALFLIAPAPLGSWGLQQVGTSTSGRGKDWASLPAATGPVSVRIREVVGRGLDAPASLQGRELILEGFIVSPGATFGLARYSIACCAADAQGAQVLIEGQPTSLPHDSWVSVVGTFAGVRSGQVVIRATSVEPRPSPPEPFE